MTQRNKTQRNSGITLVALVITIIVLMILAGISVSLVVGENGLITRAKNVAQLQEKRELQEKIKIEIIKRQANSSIRSTTITMEELEDILKDFGTVNKNSGGDIVSLTPEDTETEIPLNQLYAAEMQKVLADGSWDELRGVNSPKLIGTGLTAVYWDDDGTEHELTQESSLNDWKKWYNYGTTDDEENTRKWANAVTKDESGNVTGYFVWIPRFAYKITSKLKNGVSVTGDIDIVFVDINNKNGETTYSETYPTVISDAMGDFVVHPAFTNNITNGGWSSSISGFWVAKYPAGFQKNEITQNEDKSLSITISNSEDTVINSNVKYKNGTSNIFGTVTANTTSLTYPVFKPLTYAYNMISIGDAYSISREIENGEAFYGLTNVDSHLEKNSEWGAVAYLTQSKYGRNKEEVNINNYYTTESSPYNTAITGVYANGKTNGATQNIAEVNAYNTEVGKKGSSTANIYGVYDLNGCVWERTAGYIANGNSNITTYGASFAGKTVSTKYATVYPYDNSESQSYQTNYVAYRNAQKANYGFGDAVLETSKQGTGGGSWNNDYSSFPTGANPFFLRGGRYLYTSHAGSFAFNNTSGNPYYYSGFRAVLVAE